MASFKLILLVASLVVFLLAAANVSHPRINMLALGLAFAAAAFILPLP